jgi:hypothetical protein
VSVGDAEVVVDVGAVVESEGVADEVGVLLPVFVGVAVGVVLDPTPTMLGEIGATGAVVRTDGTVLWIVAADGTVPWEDGAVVDTGSVPRRSPSLSSPPIVVTILFTPTDSGSFGR